MPSFAAQSFVGTIIALLIHRTKQQQQHQQQAVVILFFQLLLFVLISSASPSAFAINSSRRHSPSSDEPSILITVKTTMANHRSRVEDALSTWASTGANGRRRGKADKTQILFVTDTTSPASPSPLIKATKCPPGHTNAALCCKMAAELRMALQGSPDFWCHFDDDNFVLLDNLRTFLRQFSPERDDLYLGRPSTSGPITLPQADDDAERFGGALRRQRRRRRRHFWFGTGGAGICLSASTLSKLRGFISGSDNDDETTGQPFQWLCAKLGVPDDVTLGFILENLLDIPLTRTDRLHSHLDRVDAIPRTELAKQISLSGSWSEDNLVSVPEQFQRRPPPHNANSNANLNANANADGSSSDLLRFRALYKFIIHQQRLNGRDEEANWRTKSKE